MRLYPVTNTSTYVAVVTAVAVAASALVEGAIYLFASTTNCWIRQGTSKLLTLATKANLVDGEYITITANGTAVIYEFDVNGLGVTAGRVQVDVSGATTAASVAVILRTAILANQTTLTVTDPANGTLVIDLPASHSLTITEAVAHASLTVGTGTMQATAAAGSMFVPAGVQIPVQGNLGGQLGVIRDTADGKSSTTRCMVF